MSQKGARIRRSESKNFVDEVYLRTYCDPTMELSCVVYAGEKDEEKTKG